MTRILDEKEFPFFTIYYVVININEIVSKNDELTHTYTFVYGYTHNSCHFRKPVMVFNERMNIQVNLH